jgi:hypothetical protein
MQRMSSQWGNSQATAMSALHWQRLWVLSVLAALVSAWNLFPVAWAEPQQALAILLKQLHAKPLGLYDGVRLFRLNQPGGGTLTLTVSSIPERRRVLIHHA